MHRAALFASSSLLGLLLLRLLGGPPSEVVHVPKAGEHDDVRREEHEGALARGRVCVPRLLEDCEESNTVC